MRKEEMMNELLGSLQKISQDQKMPRCYRDWAFDGIGYARSREDAEGMAFVASIFHYGRGERLPEDIEIFLRRILKEETDRGNGYASYYLGKLMEEGYLEGREEDIFDLYEDASHKRCRKAYEDLGRLCLSGKGTDIDEEKAFLCFEKNALLGSISSLLYLAHMYQEGLFVEKDEEEAFFLYDLAYRMIEKDPDVEQRGEVFEALSACYLYGKGTLPDYHNALFYAQMAEADYWDRRKDGERGLKEKSAHALSLQAEARMMLEEDQED